MSTHVDKQELAWQLKISGATDEQIRQEVGYKSLAAVRAGLSKAALRHLPYKKRELESFRDIELARLDEMQLIAWDEMTDGNLSAIDRILKIMQHRAALLGLDANRSQPVSNTTNNVLVVGNTGSGADTYLEDLKAAAGQLGVGEQAAMPAASNGRGEIDGAVIDVVG